MQYVDIVENIMKTTNKFHLLLYIHFYKRYLDKLCIAYYMTEHSVKSKFCLKVSLKFILCSVTFTLYDQFFFINPLHTVYPC